MHAAGVIRKPVVKLSLSIQRPRKGYGSATSSSDFDSRVSRDVREFRMKYLCSQSCTQFCHYRRRRLPAGKAVALVFLTCFLERVAYWQTLGTIIPTFLAITDLSGAEQTFIQAIFQLFVHLMYPLMGWVADVWIGRYRTVHGSLWVSLIGYSFLALLFSFDKTKDPSESFDRYLLPLCFLMISVGAAGVQANLIPFGADQVMYGASEQLSSYFYWYYWVMNLAGVFQLISVSCSHFSTQLHIVILACIAALCITLALSINTIFRDWLFIDRERQNPLKIVVKVLYNALTTRRPRVRSAFSHDGREPPPRIDLAKMRHGGKFSNEQVEDVKTFLRLLVILAVVAGSLLLYSGVS